MIIINLILFLIAILISSFTIWALSKLNKYIAKLEKQIENQIDRVDEVEDLLQQSNIKNKKIIKRNIISDDTE